MLLKMKNLIVLLGAAALPLAGAARQTLANPSCSTFHLRVEALLQGSQVKVRPSGVAAAIPATLEAGDALALDPGTDYLLEVLAPQEGSEDGGLAVLTLAEEDGRLQGRVAAEPDGEGGFRLAGLTYEGVGNWHFLQTEDGLRIQDGWSTLPETLLPEPAPVTTPPLANPSSAQKSLTIFATNPDTSF